MGLIFERLEIWNHHISFIHMNPGAQWYTFTLHELSIVQAGSQGKKKNFKARALLASNTSLHPYVPKCLLAACGVPSGCLLGASLELRCLQGAPQMSLRCFPINSMKFNSIQFNSIHLNSIQIKPNQIEPNQVKPNQINSTFIKSSQTKSNQTKSNQTKSNQTKSNSIKLNHNKSNQVKSN